MRCFHGPRATSYLPLLNPHPGPRPREGLYWTRIASRERRAGCELQLTSHEPRTTTISHKLQAACCSFPTPRTRPPLAAEIRGPCRKRSRGSVVADAQTPKRRGGFETLPYRLRAGKPSMALRRFYRPHATSHRPSCHRHHAPRTTYHVPRTTHQQGGHTGPPLRRDESQATSH